MAKMDGERGLNGMKGLEIYSNTASLASLQIQPSPAPENCGWQIFCRKTLYLCRVCFMDVYSSI